MTEIDALRAELAALRGKWDEEVEFWQASSNRWLGKYERARALLARWLPLAWQCDEGLLVETRAFLAPRRDEGPRCTCPNPALHAELAEGRNIDPALCARDEARDE